MLIRHPRPAVRPAAAAVVALAMLLALFAAPAAGKEGLEATLDAPIAFDSPPGEILLVGATVVALDDATGEWVPVIGTPVYLRLTGPDGDWTRAAAEGTRIDGYYRFHIAVPAGGPRQLEMGVHGSNQDGPMDLPMTVAADPFTFGPIRDGTAQLAPPTVAAPVVSVAPAAPVAPVVASAAAGEPAPAAPDAGMPAWVAVVGVVSILVMVAGAALAAGRSRGADRRAPGGAGGG